MPEGDDSFPHGSMRKPVARQEWQPQRRSAHASAMQRGSPVQPAMQAEDADHGGRGRRLLLRNVRVQMTFVSSLRSEASEITASVHLMVEAPFVQRLFRPPGLRWSVWS